ncbi:MAG: DMT family transporter [Chitinophagaceae bacterium]
MKKALLQLNAAVFLWGFTGVLGRLITLSETWLVWYRLLVTAVSLWIIYFLLKKIRKLPLKSILFIAFIGTIQALHWVCFYGSVKYANVTIALTCLSTSALLSAFIEPLLLKKKFDGIEILLGVFAIAGILVIYNSHIHFSLGIVIGLVSALLTAIVSVLNKKIINDFTAETITIYQLTGGFLGLTLLLPLNDYLFPAAQVYPTKLDWLWLFILSWVCTIFTFFLYITSLKKVSAFTMNLILTLEPVYGILLAFVIFKENKHLNNWFYSGFALITFSVVLHMWRLLQFAGKRGVS